MKRNISILLVVSLLFCSLSLFVAADAPTQLCYVKLPAENDMFICEPLEGYDVFVPRGENFRFYIQGKDGYSVKSATVSVDGMIFYETDDVEEYFPGYYDIRVFTIENIVKETEVKVTTVFEVEKAGLFDWLITFVTKLVQWFTDIFGNGFNIGG